MDPNLVSVQTFNKRAERYQAQFMQQSHYAEALNLFCQALTTGAAHVLDAACGPGNVAHYLLQQRPELDLFGIDLAPQMVELARQAIPAARFEVQDCRRLSDLGQRFDGIVSAFGLPYLAPVETTEFLAAVHQALNPAGVLYLSTMLGNPEDSGLQRNKSSDEVYVYYHSEQKLLDLLAGHGFKLLYHKQLASPAAASQVTSDLILIAQLRV